MKVRTHRSILLLMLLAAITPLAAQDTLVAPPEENINQRIIEDVVEQIGEEEDFDFNTQFEQLNNYVRKPLNLNRVTAQDLYELGLLTPQQVSQFMRYREMAGDLLVIEELQAVPTFDLNTIERILPYVTVRGEIDDFNVPLGEMLYKGQNALIFRARTLLEEQRGFKVNEATGEPNFTGDPFQLYARYQYDYDGRLKYGITMEKDAGEGFLDEYNPYGFDYYSAHFYIHNLNKTVKDIAIGDFEAKFGQGLTMWSGFGFGKSSFVMNTKRIGRAIKNYSSVNEFAFLRGAGATINLNDNWEVTAFASYKNRDANVASFDTLEQEVLEVSSLQTSGLHRTLSEIDDEGSIREFVSGASIQYNISNNAYVAANGVFTQYSAPLNRSDATYNVLRFQDSSLLNLSLDYSYVYKNINFFGETAMNPTGGWATLNGLLIGLNRITDLAILHRNFQPDYHVIYTNTFAETSGTSNEIGTYIGLQVQPSRRWQYSFYFDAWRHPWLRFQVDAPSTGVEYLGQITFKPKRGTQLYLRVRDEIKQRNTRDDGDNFNTLTEQRRINTRLHFQHKFTKALEWRTRLEMVHYKQDDQWEEGWMMYQDLIYKPWATNYYFTTRFALFETDSYNSRIYAYENDLLYSFSIPPYYYRGSRFYFNITYRPIRAITLQARYARSRFYNQETISSGNTEIDGNTRSEVKFLIRYKF